MRFIKCPHPRLGKYRFPSVWFFAVHAGSRDGLSGTEAYLTTLSMEPPSVYVVLRPAEDADHPHEVEPFAVTASAFEAQDYLDSGEETVEPVLAPPGLVAWIREFTEAHHVEEEFKKRKRRNWSEQVEDGRGDERIRQDADVYRAPGAMKPRSVH